MKQKADSEEAAQEHRGLESPAPEIKDKGQSVDEVQESTPPVEPKQNTNEWQKVISSKSRKGHSWADQAANEEVQHALTNLFQVLSSVGVSVEGGLGYPPKVP